MLHTVWAFAVHHKIIDTLTGVIGYRVWKELPRWLVKMRLAVTNDLKKAKRLRKDVAALEPPWRWPWQRDD